MFAKNNIFNLINSRGLTIAVDICNTIADINSQLEMRLGKNPNPNQYYHPKLKEFGGERFFINNLDVFANAKPIENSQVILSYLSKNNRLVYITARPKESTQVTIEWLRNHKYPCGEVYFTKDKLSIANQLNVDIAIEDAPKEIYNYQRWGIPVYVKRQDYNLHFNNRFEWGDIKYSKLKLKGELICI